jgi:hypothetical protein
VFLAGTYPIEEDKTLNLAVEEYQMSRQIEIMVNAQCSGEVTLARIRGVQNAKTIKITNAKQLVGLPKNSGAIISVDGFVEQGNYLIPTNCKVVDVHISGKAVALDDVLGTTEPDAKQAIADAGEVEVDFEPVF